MGITIKPVVVDQLFKATIDDVWKAITDINEMKLWYFNNIPDFEPQIWFKTKFTVKSDNRYFTHLWTITEVIPYKKISYTWQYEEYTGESTAHFELTSINNLTKLKVTCVGLETFPNDIPEFTHESCDAGWTYFIKNRLIEYLENKV